MSYTLFTGCSYTQGNGFDLLSQQPELWVNLLHKKNPYSKKTQLLNVAVGGRSNAGIFQDTVWNLLNKDCKYALVEWTSARRFEFSLGLELYETKTVFGYNFLQRPHQLHDVVYSKDYLENIQNRLVTLINVHLEICNLLYYINIIINLANRTDTKLFFINGICPWDNNYFNKLTNILPNSYTDFTKILLDTDTRDDEQVFELYEKIHNEYLESGGIHPEYWINLYQSMFNTIVDYNNDGIHPGIQSNQHYSDLFNQSINSRLQSI